MEGVRACSDSFHGLFPVALPLSWCRLVGRTTTLRSLFGDLYYRIPIVSFVMLMSLLICLHSFTFSPTHRIPYLHLFFYPHSPFPLLSRFRYLGCSPM